MLYTKAVQRCGVFQRSFTVNSFLKQLQTLRILCQNNFSDSGKLTEHQRELMSRGLPKRKPIDGVKNIILVVSGKGGVGKSTTSVNTAVALAELKGLSIGLLDADVFGPSIPLMMGVNESPALTQESTEKKKKFKGGPPQYVKENGWKSLRYKKMIPVENYGVKCMSMGFLVTETSAVIWRGLMVMSALERLLRHVAWGNIDYLIVDTPPGTGDTLLSLMQNIPISGVLMVSTPQKAAVQVARRGATMLQKLSVPIIGLVENMSSIQCPKCKHDIPLFGEYTEELAKELNIPLLARIPLETSISTASDGGIPVVLSSPQSIEAGQFKIIAKKIVEFSENHVILSNG